MDHPTPHWQGLSALEAEDPMGCGQEMQQILGTASCSHHSPAGLPHARQRVLGAGWESSMGGTQPSHPGAGGWRCSLGMAAPTPQHIQPWEQGRNLGLGMAGENKSCGECLQCRGIPEPPLQPRCQSMQRIPKPKHCQEPELSGELSLATALSMVASGDRGVTLGVLRALTSILHMLPFVSQSPSPG